MGWSKLGFVSSVPMFPSLHRSSPLLRCNHGHRGPDSRCPVHGPWGPRGGWHCWLLLWKPAHSRSYLFPLAIFSSKFLVLAGTEDFYLLGHRSSCVIFSWEEVSRVAGLSLTMVRRTIGQGRSMLPDELCRTTILFINWCPLSKKA